MNKICRICLEEGVLSSIFNENYTLSMCEMIEYCSSIKISRNDGLPEQICSNCMYKLGIAYHFKQSSESSDIRLRQYLGLPAAIKCLDASVMTDPIETRQTTIIKKCKCKFKEQRKTSSNYKRKSESEKLKRGPKPKPKKIHSCFQCQKEFRCHAQLETHIRTHTGDKPFICLYCPKRFNQKHNLTIHQRLHTGEKPFQCDVCSKRFSAQSNLHTHLKIHTGQKDHVCTVCNKSFITSSELTRHMNKHRGVKNFKCDLCGSAYVHSRDLKLHKLTKHQLIPEQKTQNEAFNNTNIDIIGVDDGNSIPNKELDSHFIIPNKHNHSIITESPALLYEQKDDKVYHYKMNESHSCTICGEGFNCVASLAQHCHCNHKGYEPIHAPKSYV